MGGAARLTVREVKLAVSILIGCLIAHQFRDAQNGGQRIVQFMGHSGDHLPHRRKPLGLNQLLLQPLLLGNVAHRSDDPGGAPHFVMKWTRGSAKQLPGAIFMLGAIFDLAIRAVPGNQIGNEFLHRREIMRINVAAKFLADQILGLVTENIKDLRTYEGISRFGVKRDDQIGETIHQAARKFLFTMQATLHFTLLGDVHECALITHEFARRVADNGRGVQRNDFARILPVL